MAITLPARKALPSCLIFSWLHLHAHPIKPRSNQTKTNKHSAPSPTCLAKAAVSDGTSSDALTKSMSIP